MKSKVNHNALKLLIEAGSINSATAVAEGDTWILKIIAGETEKTVMAKNSGKARIWRKLETLTKYLKDLGLEKFTIDASAFDPTKKSLQRPDSAAILKRTHQAHKTRTTTEITDRLLEKSRVRSEEVKERWEQRRAKILQQENARAK